MMEREYAYSRVGKASEGCQLVPVNLVIAMFEHASSRAKDPNLHIHTQILNIGVDDKGDTRAIDPTPIFFNQKLFTRYYFAKLSADLRTQFRLVTEVDDKGIHIRGIPSALVQEYSKRSRQIRKYLKQRSPHWSRAAWAAATVGSSLDGGAVRHRRR